MYDRIYGIYDLLGEKVIGSLVFFPGDPAAIRMFTDVVRAPDNVVSAHPRDYSLVVFGEIERDPRGYIRIKAYDSFQTVMLGRTVVETDAHSAAKPTDDDRELSADVLPLKAKRGRPRKKVVTTQRRKKR